MIPKTLIASALTNYVPFLCSKPTSIVQTMILKKTVKRAEQNKEGFAEEQEGGSRKNFRVVELALNKVLTYNQLQ
jgi:hypothetical protein